MLSRLYTRWATTKLSLAAPRLSEGPRGGIGIAAIVRNEAAHIGEWAAHHQAVGVTRFFIYDDGSNDGTTDCLRDHLSPGATVTVTPWAQRLSDARLGREVHNQVLAYAHAAANHAGDLRWMAFIDVDEFLLPVRHATLDEALAGLAHRPAISLPQLTYLCLSEDRPPEGVLRGATRRLPEDVARRQGLMGFKTIADPSRITALRVHSVECDGLDRMWNDRGEALPAVRHRHPGHASADVIRLHHYYVRSQRDLDHKLQRGPNLRKRHAAYADKVARNVRAAAGALVEDGFAPQWLARNAGLG